MKILLIKPGAVGDLLQLTPVVRALKKIFSNCSITILVGSSATASMFTHDPLIDSVVIYDRNGAHHSLRALFQLWRELRRIRFDLVVNFQRSNVKGWLLALAAFPSRILVYHKARRRVVHAVINHLEAVAPLGIDPLSADHNLLMVPGPEAECFADYFFAANNLAGRQVVALNPGASTRLKCWPPRNFGLLSDRLMRELNAVALLVGGPDERDLAEAICAAAVNPPLDLLGKTTLPQLGAVLKRCAAVVSGDTGPLHMATAVGTPVVALFGAIDPRRTGPMGDRNKVIIHNEIRCVPCTAKRCDNLDYLACMEAITVDEVFKAVQQLLITKGNK